MAKLYRQEMSSVFQKVDLILTPGTPCIAPKVGTKTVELGMQSEAVGNALTRFTSFFNITGSPAMTIPCGFHTKGLPISFQLIADVNNEETLIRTALTLEHFKVSDGLRVSDSGVSEHFTKKYSKELQKPSEN